jgi:hypothetical protein
MTRAAVASILLVLGAASMQAAEPSCGATNNVEELRYAWRLRGGVRFLAGFMFPTSGVGNLRTTFSSGNVQSELLITAPNGKQGGYYAYESEMDERASRTLMTYHGYAWGKKMRNERTVFDYVKRLARIRKQTPDEIENRVKPLPSVAETRDILTAIYYLRQNAQNIHGPLSTSIFSDGKEYPVIFRPVQTSSITIDGRRTPVRGFEIIDAPGGKKWQGGVKVWLSNDERRMPLRIEIQQSIASMQLDLKSVESCASKLAQFAP